MFFRIPFDFAYLVALDIEIEDFLHGLGLLWHDLQDAVRPVCVAEELRVVQHGFPTSHAVTDAKFDVLATEMAFGLINGSELVNYTVADVQSIDPAD